MKSYLTIGIGCTGGKHRSVAIGQRLADDLASEATRSRSSIATASGDLRDICAICG